MDTVFELSDEFGPLKVVHVHNPTLGLKGILVIDNIAAGPGIGGVRMAPDVSLGECFRLARAMTLKNAAAELPHGGAKAVLFGDPRMPRKDKERLVRGFASALRDERGYIFGPDMGTDESCMAWVRDEHGRAVGLPRELGGIPLDEIGATGWGVCEATRVAADRIGLPLKGARVVVQGFGAVGMHSARFLARHGAVLVGAADSRGAVHDADGLDVDALWEVKREGGSVADLHPSQRIAQDELLGLECEIWIPAARPDVIHGANVDRLRTRIVVEGANIPTTREAEGLLFERGVLVVPDFIANAGGVICGAMEYRGATEAQALQAIGERIRRNTALVLEEAARDRVTPRAAATELALHRIRRAMDMRRLGMHAAGPDYQ